MPLRAVVDAGDGAEAARGAKGAAGPPRGRPAAGGVERAPALPELAKGGGAMLEERGDVLAAPDPPAPAPIGGRMKGGATGRAPAPPVPAGETVPTGAAMRPDCATAGAVGAGAAGIAGKVGAVARTTGTAADVRALASAGVASDATAPASIGDAALSGRSRKDGAALLGGGGGADDMADLTRASAAAP
ncbi:MAG: hypothetical protein LH467_03520 [Gemmatimonadaceae bacterium]|nr:hypothetical protein [Gemmatimonadaceae bacterium]